MERFYQLLNKWNEHYKKPSVQLSSNTQELESPEYKELIGMG